MAKDTVTLVTGAGVGIGAALCRRIAAPGQTIFVHSGKNRANADAVAADVRAKGATAHVLIQSFDDPAQSARMIDAVRDQEGRLDNLVNVVGFANRQPIGELKAPDFEASMLVNAHVFFHIATAALPLLRESKSARIVSVSSFLIDAFRLDQDFLFPATAASKAALTALTKSLAMQLAPEGINVNCVVPGFIKKGPGQHTSLTDEARKRVPGFIPMGRLGEPEEVAAAIEFLLSPGASYITGQCLNVDGGVSL